MEAVITPLELSQVIAGLALEKKATDMKLLDVDKLVSYADIFVICNGSNPRQVRAIAQHIQRTLRDIPGGGRARGIEGMESGKWVLLDYGDVIVHVFEDSLRDFYDLDSLWADAPRVAVAPPVRQVSVV